MNLDMHLCVHYIRLDGKGAHSIAAVTVKLWSKLVWSKWYRNAIRLQWYAFAHNRMKERTTKRERKVSSCSWSDFIAHCTTVPHSTWQEGKLAPSKSGVLFGAILLCLHPERLQTFRQRMSSRKDTRVYGFPLDFPIFYSISVLFRIAGKQIKAPNSSSFVYL